MKQNLFLIAFLGFALLSYYRAAMNAALNVFKEELPIKNWDDILESDYRFFVWLGTSDESMLKDAPESSVQRKIYEEKVAPNLEQINLNSHGLEKVLDYVADDSSLMLYDLNAVRFFPGYSCNFTHVKSTQ